MKSFDPNLINEKVLALMRQHGTNWKQPWINRADFGMPMNVASKRNYQGINVPITLSSGFQSCFWGSYKQWQALGAQVRKGETAGAYVVLFKPLLVTDNNSDEGKMKTIPLMRSSAVFNSEQVDGWTPPAKKEQKLYETRGSELVDDLFQKVGVQVEFKGNRACYYPSWDVIHMPLPGQFMEAVRYDGTRLHELGHWTGHPSRMARDLSGWKGSDKYANEELVAELYSMYMGMFFGIEIEPEPDHAMYINNWMQAIIDEKWAFYRASKQAWKAMQWVLEQAGIPFNEAVELEEKEEAA